ncbi:MAG TPA: hypothetical protein VK773_01110 [Acidimicrobiales bacterium]|nr:hypothetical protein [Acidimicrobiales bacterium]
MAERRAPVVATLAMFVPVLAYSLMGHAGLHGGRYELVTPSDLWGLAASSWALVHGQFAHIYVVPQGTLTSPPALEVALAPVLLLAQATGLAAPHSGQPVGLWLLLAPAVLLFACTLLFAVDAVARQWDLSDGRRLALGLASALGVANVTGVWGHPEDCIAVAMVLWSALALERRGGAAGPRAALLLGIGIAFQPLAILAVAPVLARLGWRSAARTSWRLVLPSLVVLTPALLGEPGRVRFVLVDQPFLPGSVSFTPLTRLAPVIGHGIDGGGPTRLLATVLAVALAVVVCRRRHDLPTVLTMCAVAFFLRVLFETELNWYYLWPVAALCLLLAARRSGARLTVCAAAVVASMVLGNHNTVHDIALWWPALMALLVVMLASAAAWDSAGARTGREARRARPTDDAVQLASSRSAA